MADYYDELLKICGFESQEINKERARIEKAFEMLELSAADMKTAESWLKENHDVELVGVRKILGLWLKELIDLVLAKDDAKKLVYFGFPAFTGPASVIAAASEQIFCTSPDVVLCYSLGQIFNKLTPILEAGEENGLPPGHGLCSLQQVKVGGMVKGVIPVPDLAFTSGYYCDIGSKTDEFLHERYRHPVVYVGGSMDSRWGEYPDYLPERAEYMGKEFDKYFDEAEKFLGVKITEEVRHEGASRGGQFHAALSELIDLVKKADPQPISIVEVELARRLINGSASRRIITEGPKAISTLNREVKERIDKGIGVVEKGAPRVVILMAPFSDPSIMRMIENLGLSIPGALHTLMGSKKMGGKASLISGEMLAKRELGAGTFHSTYGYIKGAAGAAQEVADKLSVDGVIWSYIFNCRPIAQSSYLLKQFIEKETRIPVLLLEMDMYDSRTYSAGALMTRVEAFADMLRCSKASTGRGGC